MRTAHATSASTPNLCVMGKEKGQVLHCHIRKSLPFSPLSKIAWMKPPSTMLRTGFDFAQDRLRRIRDARRICSPDFIRAMKLKIRDLTLFPSRH